MARLQALAAALAAAATVTGASTAAASSVSPLFAPTPMAPTPPLGWSSWNFWGCNINGTILMQAAEILNTSGLAAAGYNSVHVDDCWALKERDPTNFTQVPDPDKFPMGMKAVVDYVHSLGSTFAIYTARSNLTCAGFAASCGHEAIDAAQYAAWGVDYVKDDR